MNRIPFVCLVAASTVGCPQRSSSSSTEGVVACAAHLASGDLRITEVMADPSGADAGHEWLEVKNARASAVDLGGLAVVTNGTSHPVEAAVLAAGTYYVFDDIPLRNSDGEVELRCGDVLVDRATYSATTEGSSKSFDGTTWCDVKDGTPGEPNPTCTASVAAGRCREGAIIRDIRAPRLGDLVLSEVQAGDKPWLELRVLADVDLNDLQIGLSFPAAKQTLTTATCQTARAGSFPVVDLGFPLVATGGSLFIGRANTLLDWASFGAMATGQSYSIDPVSETGCATRATPGAQNPPCEVPVGQCNDGGTVRDIIRPELGDLLVTEIMANPRGSAERGKEWFEVFVDRAVDLAGLQVASGGLTQSYSATDCLPVAAGTFLVFANGDAATVPRPNYLFDFSLGASGSLTVTVDGILLDSAAWSGTTDGVSRTLRRSAFDIFGNDAPANYCDSTLTYGDGMNRGTPGADDLTCR